MKKLTIFLISFLCLSHQVMPALPVREDSQDSWSDTTNILWEAIKNNAPDLAIRAIADGANVNAKNDDGITPLMYATNFGYREIVQILVNSEANVNAVTTKNIIIELLNILIENQENNDRALFMDATGKKSTNIIDIFIQKLKFRGINGWTALMYAASNADTKIARILLDFGADPDKKTIDDKTARQINSTVIDEAILANRKQVLKETEQYSALTSKLHKNPTGSSNTAFMDHIFKYRNQWKTSQELAALARTVQ